MSIFKAEMALMVLIVVLMGMWHFFGETWIEPNLALIGNGFTGMIKSVFDGFITP